MSKQFEGFKLPNTTPVPDILFDELLSELTGNELKVLLYIIRRTYGFGKNADAISLGQFRKGITTKDEKVLDKGCGIEHNRTILVALRSLEAKGYIISKKRQTKLGDDDTTIYRLHFQDSPEANGQDMVVTSSNYPSLPQVTTLVTSGNDGRYPTSLQVVTPGNPQETVLQQTEIQETVRQESTLSSPLVDDAPAPIDLEEQRKKRDTEPRIPAINLKGHTNVSPTHSVLPDRRRDHADREHSESAGTAEHARLEAQQMTTVPPVLAVGQAANGAHAAPTFSPPSLNGVQRGAGAKAVHKKVTQAKQPFTLDAQQQAFWDLWCNVWFNVEIKPILTETAYGHISKLAPYITDAAQLDSLIDYTRKYVAESIGMKHKMVQLGNMVHCYAGWKQAQPKPKEANGPTLGGYYMIGEAM